MEQATREQLIDEVARDPSNPDKKLALARKYIEEHAPARALPLIEETLSLDEDNPHAFLALGLCWGLAIMKEMPIREIWGREMDEEIMVERAIDAFERALEIDPELVLAYNSLARIYTVRGQDEEAEEMLNQSLNVDQGQIDVLEALQELTGKHMWEIQGRETDMGDEDEEEQPF
ncbi:tetratricopeptide repeat protein [Candidatus Fermentibacterales bacterium]|nr:tetratricopeptide repeat protein [Candidatus Fermentibacterales bacterium]